MRKSILFTILLVIATSFLVFAQSESVVDEYTKVITQRSDKIVDAMTFENEALKIRVRDIVVDHYRFLNGTQEEREADVAKIREEFSENKELKNAKIDLRKAEQEIKIRNHHFAFLAQLKQIISEEQIDQVKNGLTYNVLNVTYNGFCDMIPSMTNEEKDQLMIWLWEAREHAIDGGSSREKHNWFGKYKGRMNNYLSKRGYDLKQERINWEARLKKEGKKL